MKIVNIVGARPNFTKIAPLMKAMRKRPGIQALLVVHTGQHYDPCMAGRFFEDQDIPRPDVCPEVGSGTHAIQTAEFMKRLEQVLQRERPDLVVMVGDVNADKVASINAGSAPIVEPEIGDFIAKPKKDGLLKATVSSDEGIHATDVSFICVGTPSRPNGGLDLTHLKRVCEDIGQALKSKKTDHTIVFRSTTPPGTTEDVAIPILEKHSGRRVGEGLYVNPEFLREGDIGQGLFSPSEDRHWRAKAE